MTAGDVVEPADSTSRGWPALLPSTPLQWVSSVLSLLILAGAVGYFLGTRGDDPPARDTVEVGFLYDMLIHHEQGQRLANAELIRGAEPAVETFAREVLLFQSYEIGLMEQKLAEWGYARDDRPAKAMEWMGMATSVAAMPGMASIAELQTLERVQGRDVDALFVPLMQDHHRGAVHMASYAAERADDPFVRKLAALIARNQRIEVRELELVRERTELPRAPSGYQPADIPTPAE
jgi:uncharacterized protein (DUF305 family)